MRMSFFGQYLVARGIITQAQLQEALEYQAGTNRRIGELAVEQGHLTEEQVAEILAEQATRDLSFGVIALEKGLLRRSVLHDLLFAQNIKSVYVGEALVHKGFADMETIGRELNEFSRHFQEREKDLSSLLEDFPESVFLRILLESLQKSLLRFARCSMKVLYVGDMKELAEEYKDHIVIELAEEDMSVTVVLAVSHSGFSARSDCKGHSGQEERKVGQEILRAIGIAVHYVKDALKNYGMEILGKEEFQPLPFGDYRSFSHALRVTLTTPFGSVGFSVASFPKSQESLAIPTEN